MRQLWESYLKLWKKLAGWRLFAFYLLHYTVLFLLLQWCVFSDFHEAEKSFIWQTDGISQYFPRLVYISQTIREGIQSLLRGEGWTIPLYDFRLGAVKPQFDIEPLQLLATLWPWDRIDELYDILFLFRLYLAGATFSQMGLYFGQKPLPVMLGSLSYAFCGYSLYFCMFHPAFAGPMILLPLLIIGAEKILKGEQAWGFSCCVFLAVLSELYLACMLAAMIILYFFVRYCCAYSKGKIEEFGKLVGRMALWGGIGILLSGIVLAPSILQMIGTGRIGREVGSLLRYDSSYYQRFLMNFTTISDGVLLEGSLGFPVLAIPCIVSLFLKKRGEKSVRLMFLFSTGMLMIPAVGYVLSGFNNIVNRWSFGYALCVCSVIMFQAPKLLHLNKQELALTLSGSLAYIVLCRFIVDQKYYFEEPLAMLFLLLIYIAICYITEKNTSQFLLPIFLCSVCLSAYYGAFLRFDPSAGNAIGAYVKKNYGYETLGFGQYASLGNVETIKEDKTFFRVAGSSLAHYDKMWSFYYGLNGTSFYSSSFFPSYVDLQNELEVKRTGAYNANYGNDARAPLLALNNVKYYAARESNKAAIPFGFEKIAQIKNGKNTDIILENTYHLPVGYTYDFYLNEKEFSQLFALDQQNAMLQGVLTEKDNKEFLPETIIEATAKEIPAEIAKEDNLEWTDGKLTILDKQATITLSFQAAPNTETYLRIVGFDPTPGNDGDSWDSSVWDISVETDDTYSTARFIADNYVYAHGVKSQLVYLGNSPDGYTSCTITFPKKGEILLSDLEIWCQPMDAYAEQIEALRTEVLENVETNWRGLTGTISTSKDKFLCFSIPYDEGWTAYVDGEKLELVQANIGFMGVELPAGDHKVELKYWPPGMTLGIALSGTGVAGAAVLAFWQRKRKEGSS